MRTTLNLDPTLMKRAKAFAARQGKTLTSLMEESLRRLLDQYAGNKNEKLIDLPTMDGKGIAPGVDLNDTAELYDFMEREK